MKEIKKEENQNPVKIIDDKEDYIVKSIGAFGRWQFIFCLLVSLSRFIPFCNLLSFLFLTAQTEFLCVKFLNQSSLFMSTNKTIKAEVSVCYADCVEYEYTQNVFERTVIAEFGLICERQWMSSFLQTILVFGLVVGISLFGWISDKFGRSRAIFTSVIINILFMFGAPFSPNYWIFAVFRFLIGLASGGIITSTPVYISEIVGPKVKDVAGTLSLTVDQLSTISLALFAYLAPTWRWYQLQYSSVAIFVLAAILFIPETPRWLIATKKYDEAVILMTKAARYNGKCTESIRDNVMKDAENLKINNQSTLSYFDLFKTRKMATITISSIIVWFVTGACYFGISEYTSFLGSNIFITVAIMELIQIPSIPIAILVTRNMNKQISVMFSLGAVSATMILLVFIPQTTWICTMIAMFGTFAINTVYVIIYLYVVELYDTPMRNMGFSINNGASKVGAMVAPFLANIKPHWLATLIFALLALIAIGFCLLLPKTTGVKLRDGIVE